MTLFASTVLSQAGAGLGGFLPRLGGAFALLIIGLILVRVLARVLIAAMRTAQVDEMATRGGVTQVLISAGLGDSLAFVIGRAVRIALSIVVIFAALSLLGLQFLSDSLNKGIQELSKLLIAAALVLAGVVLGGFARERAERASAQMDLPVPLGRVAQFSVLAVFGIIAAAQVAVSTLVLLLLVGVLLAGVTGTFTLAFGLGGRDVARALSAGRYLRHDYRPGQDIGFGAVRGHIVSIEPSSTVIDPGDGTRVRVPNHILIEAVVTIYAEPGPDEDELG